MYVVVGNGDDGPDLSEQVYGPYSQERAEAVAAELKGGNFQDRDWTARPLMLSPWEVAYGRAGQLGGLPL
ncbi:hypothetical protein BBK14_01840 [Parafrankia soli]|uniref:Uncharacterized protein n=2 Tax=Parafrankia soli TaxID=2599596 RepID=A0A1S1RP94_9ACTN|nr:hypothetical protein BBK14_01840 [Parafrankia soli]